MANKKRLIMTAQEAIAKAEQELSTSRYIAECTRSPGMRSIHSKRCTWLSVIVALAKKAVNVDAVEVVYCKDCTEWGKYPHEETGDCNSHNCRVGANEFCSRGTRRKHEKM